MLPTIHSKGVAYTNNGGGRDTYISHSSGGLRMMYQPASFKRTFYNNLRVYDSHSPVKTLGKKLASGRSRSNLKTQEDTFLKSQVHFNQKYVKEASFIRQYQKTMDNRLSMPKNLIIGQSSSLSPRAFCGEKPRNVRCSLINPVETFKERENSGERTNIINLKVYGQ